MSNRAGFDSGTTFTAPVRTRRRIGGVDYVDTIDGYNTRTRIQERLDFLGPVPYVEVVVPVIDNVSNAGTNILPGSNTNTAIATVVVPRGGVVTAVSLTGNTSVTANDTNFYTFTMLNLLAAGSGSTAILSATPVNTTKATGGAGITAKVPYAMTLNATAANQRVAEGDVLQFTSTTTQSPTVVDNPQLTVRISFGPELHHGLRPRITRTAGSPLVSRTANTANGDVTMQLSATNEVNFAGMDFGDQLIIPGSRQPMLEVYASVGTITTAQSIVIGLATAYNSTLASTTKYVWFRLNASLVLVTERKDGTTTTTGQATSPSTTLTASTYYLFRVDMTTPGLAKFYVDDNLVGSMTHAFAVTDVLQPLVGIHKASGTGTVAMNCDFVRYGWDRL